MIRDVIVRGRRQGKTHLLAVWVKEAEHRVIVVNTLNEARRLREEFDLPESKVRSLNQWRVLPQHLKRGHEVALDNIEFMLDALLGAPVRMGTMDASVVIT